MPETTRDGRDREANVADRSADTSAAQPQTLLDGAVGGIGRAALQRKLRDRLMQRKESGAPARDGGDAHAIAEGGFSGGSQALPHLDRIQASFGGHDVTSVQAHVGGPAAGASEQLGAMAYASGDRVGFANSPDLHTAAHEAAHVVQQRSGVRLKGGVGEAGDSYERHADEVADRVVRGESAAELLGGAPAGASAASLQRKAVQLIGKPLDEKLGAGDTKPAYGETPGEQRRFTIDEFVAMWEKEQGHKLSGQERETLLRGCIGITAMNLHGGGNPPLDNAYATFEQAQASAAKMRDALEKLRSDPKTAAQAEHKQVVIFAKLFWSNQDPDEEKRKQPDDHAYKPDPKTGKVDMTGYQYMPRGPDKDGHRFVNFDYGFWDDASRCFWHANHCQYKDPEKAKRDPMKVFQSTREKFTHGYIDFDRIIFCAAIAEHYDPRLAAITHAGSH